MPPRLTPEKLTAVTLSPIDKSIGLLPVKVRLLRVTPLMLAGLELYDGALFRPSMVRAAPVAVPVPSLSNEEFSIVMFVKLPCLRFRFTPVGEEAPVPLLLTVMLSSVAWSSFST